MADDAEITLTKLDAAKRQLRTAIRLWFEDGDPVSVHALAYAAYEIAHVVSKKRNHTRRDLIYDSLAVKDEYRAEFNISIKKHANFFKPRRSFTGSSRRGNRSSTRSPRTSADGDISAKRSKVSSAR